MPVLCRKSLFFTKPACFYVIIIWYRSVLCSQSLHQIINFVFSKNIREADKAIINK